MLGSIHPKELVYIQQLQKLSNPLLDNIMLALNYCDSLPFYALVLIIVWFGYQKKLGVRLFFVILISSFINQDLKVLLAQPRPSHMMASLGMVNADSFGFPSGGAQNMIVIFGFLSYMLKKRWFWIASAIFVCVIGFSRIFLGLHFISDIIGGFIIGTLILALYIPSLPYMERYLSKQSKITLLLLSIGLGFLFYTLSLSVSLKLTIMAGVGISIGLIFVKEPKPIKVLWKRALLVLIVFAGVTLLYALELLAPWKQYYLYVLIAFISGLWMSYGAPYLGKLLIKR